MEKVKNIIIAILVILVIILLVLVIGGRKKDDSKNSVAAKLNLPVYEYNMVDGSVVYSFDASKKIDGVTYKLSYTVPCKHDICYWLNSEYEMNSNSYWIYYDGNGYYLFDSSNNKEIDSLFSDASYVKPNKDENVSLVILEKDFKKGIYDIANKKYLLNIDYDDIIANNGKIIVYKDKKSAIFDGTKVGEFEYDTITFVNNYDLYKVSKDSKQTLVYAKDGVIAKFKNEYEYAEVLYDDSKNFKLYFLFIEKGKLYLDAINYANGWYTKNVDGNYYMRIGNNPTIVAEVKTNVVKLGDKIEVKDGNLNFSCRILKDINNKDDYKEYKALFNLENKNIKIEK